MQHDENVVLGAHDEGGHTSVFSLSAKDRRHGVYLIGQTGTGKSTLIQNMILQDIEAGRGVGLIDPHGSLALEILDRIPRRRIEDVVYFDPSDVEHPMGLNVFSSVGRDERHAVASGFVQAMKDIWPDFFGPRMEDAFRNAALAVLENENVSLLSLYRMLSDERYRAWVLKRVRDPFVQYYWQHFDAKDKKTQAEIVSPIENKIGQFVTSSHVRNIVGQVKSSVDARSIMDGRKIFIANLCAAKIGEDKANLLGSLWMKQFQLAAMSRADVPEESRADFYLYVDEVQSFVSNAFASALSQVRKYRLCLTLAHQYRAQLRPEIASAISGNVASTIAFRVGHEDAESLQKIFGESYASSYLTSLDNGEVCAKLLLGGRIRQPFLGRTLPPVDQRRGHREKIIRRSRELYARPRELVERRITRWLKS